MSESLYILITDENELSYCVYNDENKCVRQIETHKFNEFNALKSIALPVNCDTVSCLYANGYFTLFPAALYDETLSYDYIKLSCPLDDQLMVLCDRLEAQDMMNVFTIPTVLYEFFNTFGSKDGTRHYAGFLVSALTQFMQGESEAVLVNKGAERMDIIVMQGKKVLLCERFPFSSADEFTYFILNAYNQLNLKKETKLFFTGDIEIGSNEYKAVALQIKNINFAECDTGLILPEGIEFHRHFNLLSAITCG